MSYYPTNGLGASASISASASLSVGTKKPAPKKPAPKKPAPKKPGLITSALAKIKANAAAAAKKKAQIEAARKAAAAAASKPGTPKAASVPAARPALLTAAGHAIKAASTPVAPAARPALLSEAGAKANADVMDPNKQNISTDGKCYAGKVLFENRGINFCMPPAVYAQMQLEKVGPAVVSVKPEDAINPAQTTVETEPKSNLPLKIAVGGLIAAGALTLFIAAS
jgi:hypothetical protein